MTFEMAAACCRGAMHATEFDNTLLQIGFELQINILKHHFKKAFPDWFGDIVSIPIFR